MSKLEAGKVTIEAVPFDLDTVVEAASETFAAEAARKDLDFIVDCDPIEYQLVGDPTRLKQILLNLIGNAVKFTAAGRIVVRGTLSRKGQAARLVLVVRDTGIGISESVLPQLMEKFVQASSSTTRDYGGSGLGLAISKQLAHAMGGTLSVSSELGRGSAFTLDVTLPASDRFRTTRPASLLRDVVTVIADQDLRAACARMLAAEGHHHHAADDVNGALSLLRQSAKARTVLLDEAACAGHLQRDLDKLRSSGLPIEQTIVLAGLRFESSALTDPSRDVPDVLAKPLTRSKLKGVLSTGRAPHKRAVAEGSNGSLRSSVPTAPRAVLVVEDNLTNQYVVRKTLELLGFTVSLAGDGLEAVAMAGQQAFDLVLMDLQMPRLDGIGAARRIRAQEGPNRETPIIAITANAFTDDVRRCLDAGMNGHLSKPLRRRELAEMIETVLGGVDTSHAAGGA
jgi:two-component system sensor histidine kinase/response regulator